MSSGVKVDAEIPQLFETMKLKSTRNSLVMMIHEKTIVKVDEAFEIVTSQENDREANKALFVQLKEKLTEAEPRYIVFDFRFTLPELGNKIVNKLAFIFWCSDNSNVKQKMLCASTQADVKKALKSGISFEFQANDMADLDYDTFADEIAKKA